MSGAVRSLAGLLLLYAAWQFWQTEQETEEGAAPVEMPGAALLDNITGAVGMNLSAMRQVKAEMAKLPNVAAFLRVIRTGEGTADEAGYRRLFGGELVSSFADHPRKRVTKKLGGRPITSTAAGAYQALASTWDETARIMGLTSFTPANQDLFALGRIAARGALQDVIAGRFESAVRKCAWEWASLPGSPYGQPVMTAEKARLVYQYAGGYNVQGAA